jgi:UDP-N-acetylmuramyl pentapeptide phosphotransferase/UDP-N-acetylglucosamine-1-phosphate transferase
MFFQKNRSRLKQSQPEWHLLRVRRAAMSCTLVSDVGIGPEKQTRKEEQTMDGRFPLMMDLSSVTPYLVPIVAIVGAFLVGIVAMLLKSRSSERAHRERMFLVEKGLEVPKELYNGREKTVSDFGGARAWLIILGVLCVFVGISVLIALSIQTGIRDGINGLIVMLIGVGFLAAERLVLNLIVRPRQQR